MKRFIILILVVLMMVLPGAVMAQEATPEVITFDPVTGQFEIPVVVDDAGWFETLVANPWFFAFIIFGLFVLTYGYQNNRLIKDAMDKLYASVPQVFQPAIKDATVAGTSVLMAGLGGATKVIPGDLDDHLYTIAKRATLETLQELFKDESLQYKFQPPSKPFSVPPDEPGIMG